MADEYGSGTYADSAERMQDQAAKYGQKAVDAIEAGRTTAASSLKNAAAGLHARAGGQLSGPEAVTGFAHQTADKISATAEYLQDHDMRDMAGDVERFVKAHPVQAMIGAVVFGFLAGRAARS